MYYFAYGSNMSSRRLCQRVPSARAVTVATLDRHQLKFHKVSKDGSAKCDAFKTEDANDSVYGVVFEIHPDEKIHLDRAEGLGVGYDIKQVTIKSRHGASFEAFTYYAIDIHNDLLPYHWYKDHVIIGAREHGLPHFYVEKIHAIESSHDPDTERAALETAIHRD